MNIIPNHENQPGLPTPGFGKKSGKSKDYEDRPKEELYEEAKKACIEGRSKMDKKELIHALRNN